MGTNRFVRFKPGRALGILCGLLCLAPLMTLAAEEHSGPWIDFSKYGFGGLTRMINVHPVFVHFPIVLLPMALLFYGLGISFKWRAWIVAGRVTLYLAFAAVIIAVLTGLAGAGSFPHGEEVERVMRTHKHTAYIVLGLTGILVLWSFWQANQIPRASWAFLAVIAIASYFVLQNGDLGGRMVYVQGAAVKPVVKMRVKPTPPATAAVP